MAGICTCVPLAPQRELRSERSYTIYSATGNTLENYTLIPVERAGFVVIKHVISLDEWDND